MVSLNMGDYSDGMWATCFQETAEKLLGMSSEEVGNMFEQDEEGYNKVFTDACFKTYSFCCRAKADTYNDETRVKHTVISVEPIEYNAMNK
jgi:replication factor A1